MNLSMRSTAPRILGNAIDTSQETTSRTNSLLLVTVALQLVLMPWLLGSMHLASQLFILGSSLAAFLLALIGSSRSKSYDRSFQVRELALRLSVPRQSPALWLGLFVLLYIAVQALNPAWTFRSDTDHWWLESIDYVRWLPSSVAAPFSRFNSSRALIVDASLYLVLTAIWIGVHRRSDFHLLFTVVAANAAVIALLGIAQKLRGSSQIFATYLPSNDAFFSTFIYPNHAGAYLNLAAAFAAGLACWHYQRGASLRGRFVVARASTAVFAVIQTGVAFSYSRMSIILALAFLVGLIATVVTRIAQIDALHQKRASGEFLLVLVATALLGVALLSPRMGSVTSRFADLLADPVGQTHDRTLARQATGAMFVDRWLFGWGAGCFQYGFPLYAQDYPEIAVSRAGVQRFWEHAHDDLLEIPAELGSVGTLALLSVLGLATRRLIRTKFWREPLPLLVISGCVLTLVHASVDFVFQNPAVLFLWGVAVIGAIRWSQPSQAS